MGRHDVSSRTSDAIPGILDGVGRPWVCWAALAIVAATGCRGLLGIEDPIVVPPDAGLDAAIDAPIDATVYATDVQFTMLASSSNELPLSFMIGLELTAPTTDEVTVSLAVGTNGNATAADYELPLPGPFVFAPGVTTASTAVTVIDDVLDEDNETIELVLVNPRFANHGSPSVHVATILDQDPAPSVSFGGTNLMINELDAGTMTSYDTVLNLNAPSGKTVSVNVIFSGTAALPVDYTVVSGDVPVVFPPGTTTKSFRLVVAGDDTVEINESIVMTLSSPTNATFGSPTSRTHTILNDD
jgi:hypothetical protein